MKRLLHVIRPDEWAAFRACRRQWDLSSRERRGLEPATPPRLDTEAAILDALGVYYHAGMWNWQRALVQPLAREASRNRLRQQRQLISEHHPGQAPGDLGEAIELGEAVLDRYFAWCPSMDEFVVLFADDEFNVIIPHPDDPEQGLKGPDGRPVRYRGRPHMIILDDDEERWIVEHRVVRESFTDPHQLRVDERGLSFCWAWEEFYMSTTIAGTIYNEIRLSAPLWPDIPDDASGLEFGDGAPGGGGGDEELFRRTALRRSRTEIERSGERLSADAQLMVSDEAAIYPVPSPERCQACDFRKPCRALQTSGDVEAILEDDYRPKPPEQAPSRNVGWSADRPGSRPTPWPGEGEEVS